jgi:hypothetical protein
MHADQIEDLLRLLADMETAASARTDRLRAMLAHAQSDPTRFDEAAPIRRHLRDEAANVDHELAVIHRILYLADPHRRANPWDAEPSTLNTHRLHEEIRRIEDRHSLDGETSRVADALARDSRRTAAIIARRDMIQGMMPMAFLLLGMMAVHVGRSYSLVIGLTVGLLTCWLLAQADKRYWRDMGDTWAKQDRIWDEL